MADLVIFPDAYIDRRHVNFGFGVSDREHLVYATVWLGVEKITVWATNPERALTDLREAVEIAQRGVTPETAQSAQLI